MSLYLVIEQKKGPMQTVKAPRARVNGKMTLKVKGHVVEVPQNYKN